LIDRTRLRTVFPYALLAAFAVFHCGYFFMADYSDHYRLFGRLVFPLGLFTLAAGFGQLRNSPLFRLLLAYLLYLLCTAFWAAEMDWYRLGQKATISLYLVTLLSVTYYLSNWNRRLFDQFLQGLVLVAAIAAAVNIVYFYSDVDNHFPGTRLWPYGSLTNPNEFSNVYGVFAILAMGWALRANSLAQALPGGIAALVALLLIWLGQSRTAFIALLLALLALTCLSSRGRKLIHWIIGIFSIAGLSLAFLLPEVIEEAMLRGTSLRPEIWREIWRHALESPIFGHGLTPKVAVKFENIRLFETAHNAYLQVFWQGGLVGLTLFLAVLASALGQAWKLGIRNGDMTILCILLFTMMVMLTGVDTLIERPRDQWILFWLPVSLLLAATGKTPGDREPVTARPAPDAA
jgi:O-antigen ligase